MILRTLSFTAAAMLLGVVASGQNLLRYRPAAALPLRERPMPSRVWNGSGPGMSLPHHAGPARPLLAGPLGAVTIDATTGIMFSTNGVGGIDRTEYPRTGLASGLVLPSLPLPLGVGQVNGMAFDPALRHLFLTDGTTIYEVDPAAGMLVLFAFPASPMNILAGLDFDPADPTHVYGVSTAGEVAVYDRFAGMMVAVSSPTYAWPGVEASGLALDKTAPPGARAYVLHKNGRVYDHTTGALVHSGLAGQVGMTYLPTPVHLASSASSGETVMTSAFVIDGESRFGFELHGLAATSLPLGWAVDLLPPGAPLPLFPPLPVLCSDLWVTPMALLINPGATSQPLPLPGGNVGWTLLAQPIVYVPGAACEIQLLEALHCEISSG